VSISIETMYQDSGSFISSNVSVTEHINNIITSSAQTIHAFTYPAITRHANGIHPYNLPGGCYR